MARVMPRKTKNQGYKLTIKRRYIYALIDPRHATVRYVGYSTDVKSRVFAKRNEKSMIHSHISEAMYTSTNTYKLNWLRSLIKKELLPVVDIIEEGDWTIEETAEREIYWIEYLKSEGFKLTNGTKGGDGTSLAKKSDEFSQQFSENLKAWWASLDPDQRKIEIEKRAAGHRGKKKNFSEEHKEASRQRLNAHREFLETNPEAKSARYANMRKTWIRIRKNVAEYRRLDSLKLPIPKEIQEDYDFYLDHSKKSLENQPKPGTIEWVKTQEKREEAQIKAAATRANWSDQKKKDANLKLNIGRRAWIARKNGWDLSSLIVKR